MRKKKTADKFLQTYQRAKTGVTKHLRLRNLICPFVFSSFLPSFRNGLFGLRTQKFCYFGARKWQKSSRFLDKTNKFVLKEFMKYGLTWGKKKKNTFSGQSNGIRKKVLARYFIKIDRSIVAQPKAINKYCYRNSQHTKQIRKQK